MARRRTQSTDQTIAAGEFKARCLELMDRVRETRTEYIVTKHGKPVAKLVPCDPPKRPKKVFGSMRGRARIHVETFSPIPGEWFSDPFLRRKNKK